MQSNRNENFRFRLSKYDQLSEEAFLKGMAILQEIASCKYEDT